MVLDVMSWLTTIVGGIGDFIVYIIKFITYIFDLYHMFVILIPSPFKEIFSILELIFLIKFAIVVIGVLKK